MLSNRGKLNERTLPKGSRVFGRLGGPVACRICSIPLADSASWFEKCAWEGRTADVRAYENRLDRNGAVALFVNQRHDRVTESPLSPRTRACVSAKGASCSLRNGQTRPSCSI